MKTRLLTVAFVVLLTSWTFATEKDEGWTPLFNAKDLTGLKVQFKDADKGADPAKTFRVKETPVTIE